MSIEQDKLEIARVDNLVRNFGWSKSSEEFTDTEIIITLKKARAEPLKEFGEGAD